MSNRTRWTRQQLLLAFKLYCQIPFGKIHSRNSEIIKYAKLIDRTPSALAMKSLNIASLDPVIISTGRRGLTGASVADRAMWEEMQKNWESFVMEIQKAESSFGINSDINSKIDYDSLPSESLNYSGSNKIIQSTTRVGQSFFRRSVLSAYDYRCCISGLAIPNLLVASHIIPWRVDEKNRLNPKNGLCLSALHDKAFDLGIITIANNMTIRVSRIKTCKEDSFFDTAIFAYDGKPIFLPEKFRPNKDFLSYHRKYIFKSEQS